MRDSGAVATSAVLQLHVSDSAAFGLEHLAYQRSQEVLRHARNSSSSSRSRLRQRIQDFSHAMAHLPSEVASLRRQDVVSIARPMAKAVRCQARTSTSSWR